MTATMSTLRHEHERCRTCGAEPTIGRDPDSGRVAVVMVHEPWCGGEVTA